MVELWKCIEDNEEPILSTANSQNLKHPFIYAVNEMLELEGSQKDMKKQFI